MGKKYAIVKVSSPLWYNVYEVDKILSNKRAEMVSNLKNKPVIYYDFLLNEEDGKEFEINLRTEILNYNDKVLELSQQLKEYIDILVSKYNKKEEHESIQ